MKRKFGENTVSKLPVNPECEGHPEFLAYDELREYGERNAMSGGTL